MRDSCCSPAAQPPGPPAGKQGPRPPHHTHTTAQNNKEKVQTRAICPSSNVVNIYLKNTTERCGFKNHRIIYRNKMYATKKKKRQLEAFEKRE